MASVLVPGSDRIVAGLRRRWGIADVRSTGELPAEEDAMAEKGVRLLLWTDLREWTG